MQLLNVHTYGLQRFYDERSTPPYAILSHTWTDGKEVQYADIIKYSSTERNDDLDWKKVDYTCRQAIADGFSHVWIDTCCIDKSSSAELSEAINSMFQWYAKAKICYVYMTDVGSLRDLTKDGNGEVQWPEAISNFVGDVHDEKSTRECVPAASRGLVQTLQVRQSRWFTRGWTLQELIAPELLVFYDCNWRLLGSRVSLLPDIRAATGIPDMALRGVTSLKGFGVAVRMSWASRRTTTRIEDEAYCLLGIFDINMPLLYGEGPKAFLRLQEEILKVSTDHTIFAWNGREQQLFAPSTANFADSSTIVPRNQPATGDVHEMTNRGCRISLLFLPPLNPSDTYGHAVLDCIDERAPFSDIMLDLHLPDRSTSGLLEAEPSTHTLRYWPHAERYSRRGKNGKPVAFAKEQVLILRFAQYRPTGKSTTMKFSLASDEESLSYQLYPDKMWDGENCSTVRSGRGYQRQPLAVWIGPKSADPSQRRLFKSSNDQSGILIAWRWDASQHPPRIRLVRRKCKHANAPGKAKYLLDRMESSTPLNSRFSRRWIDDKLPPDQILTYLWHGIRLTFQAQPIGINRDGIMVIAQREPSASERFEERVSRAVVWLASKSKVLNTILWGFAALFCFCAIVPREVGKSLGRKIGGWAGRAEVGWREVRMKWWEGRRRKDEEMGNEVGLEEVGDTIGQDGSREAD